MANTIRHKRGTTRPTASDISTGELAINTAEGKIFTENDSGHIFEAGELLGSFSSSTITYTVTVATKTSAHRYNGTGSSNGYKINGVFSPFLNLAPGNTYKFDQSDSSNSGHPLRFYLEADKSTAYTTNVTTNGTAGSSGAYTQIVIVDTTPLVLHYQCSAHGYMGNSVLTNSKTVNYNDLQNQPSLFDGNYNSLSNRPTIPTATSQLTNDSGFITSSSSTDVVSDTTPQLGGDLASNGSDIKFADDDKAIFGTGTGNDMEIFHESSSNVNEIRAIDGEIHIQADNFMLISDDTAGRAIYLDNSSGHLELGFDGSHCVNINGNQTEFIKTVKFDGSIAGRDITFNRANCFLEFASNVEAKFADNAAAEFGSNDTLKIYHDGTNGYIDSVQNDTLFIRNGTSGGKIKIQGNSGEEGIICEHNGSVELYEDGTKVAETTSGGWNVEGVTYSNGLDMDDNHKILLGLGDDLEIFHDGSDSYISNTTDTDIIIRNLGNAGIEIKPQNSYPVKLFYNANSKLETQNTGISVTGNIVVSGTVDGRDLATDGSKLDGIAANATNVTNNNQLTNGAGYITSAALAGASDGGNAALLDGVDSTQFLRSDQDDTTTGIITYTSNSQYPVNINGNHEGKIVLQGATNPYIMWKEGTTDKAYIRWNSAGSLDLVNDESDDYVQIGSGSSGLKYVYDGSTKTVYHTGNLSVGDGGLTSNNFTDADHSKLNGIESGATADQSASEILTLIKTVDGSGSGLNADVLDNMQPSVSASNSTIVARHSSGYIFSNYINTTDNSVTSSVSGIICKQGDDYHRTATAAAVRSFLNVADGATAGGSMTASEILTAIKTVDGSGSGLDADTLDGVNSSNFMGKTGSYWNVNNWLQFSGGHGLYYPNNYGYHVYLTNQYLVIRNNQSSNGIRVETNSGTLRGMVYANNSNQIGFLDQGGNWSFKTDRSGGTAYLSDQHFYPNGNGAKDLGGSSNRWRNVYTSDLDLSNEAQGGNDVDGTWGHYTIVEGESDLFLKNNRSGKTYKFNLTEVS